MLYTNLSSYARPTLPHTAPDQTQQPPSTAFPLTFYQNNENFAPNASFASSQHQQFPFSTPNPYSLSDLYMPGIAASSNYAFGNPETNRFLPVGPAGNFSSAFNPSSYHQSISNASEGHLENEEDKENVPLKSKVPVNSTPFESGVAHLTSNLTENCSGNLRSLERNSLENKTGPNMSAAITEDESASQPLASIQCNQQQFNSVHEERRYRERRQRNNEAAKQSRSKRRERENILREQVESLAAENKRLRQQLAETQKKLAKESCVLKLSDRNII